MYQFSAHNHSPSDKLNINYVIIIKDKYMKIQDANKIKFSIKWKIFKILLREMIKNVFSKDIKIF